MIDARSYPVTVLGQTRSPTEDQARPLLLAVNLDAVQLDRIEAELQRSFGVDFRVRGELTGADALRLLETTHELGNPVDYISIGNDRATGSAPTVPRNRFQRELRSLVASYDDSRQRSDDFPSIGGQRATLCAESNLLCRDDSVLVQDIGDICLKTSATT